MKTEDADKRAMYAAMSKKDLASIAAQTWQDTYTGFLTKYDKEQLVDFILAEYEPPTEDMTSEEWDLWEADHDRN